MVTLGLSTCNWYLYPRLKYPSFFFAVGRFCFMISHIPYFPLPILHRVAISTRNSHGFDSPKVTKEMATPPVGPAQTPNTPTVFNITNVSAAVHWTPIGNSVMRCTFLTASDTLSPSLSPSFPLPTFPGGYPDYYIFQYKRGINDWSNENTTTILNLSSSILSQSLTGLEPLTSYDVRLWSQNINGLSAFSSEATFNTFGVCVCVSCSV